MKHWMMILACIAIVICAGCSKKPESSPAVTIDSLGLQMFRPLPEFVPSSAIR
jgi:hypothetical protein